MIGIALLVRRDLRLAFRGGTDAMMGVIFFVLDERVRHAHGVWHLFVLGGSIAHYISIIGYVGI